MTKLIELGDEAKLPSGTVVRITAPADNLHPWVALARGRVWHVGRPQGPSRERTSVYYGGNPVPVELDEADARALAQILNQVRAAQYPR